MVVIKPNPLKIVIVGDPMVGKSCICKSFANKSSTVHKKFYQPTISETHEISVIVDWKVFHMVLWDTAGIEEWENLRSQDYVGADCFLCCYSIDNRTSFANVEAKWVTELRRYCPSVPIILVGTKKDLRRPTNSLITEEEGRSLQNSVKVEGFIECSSTSLSSLEALFVMAVSTIVDLKTGSKTAKRFSCVIL